MLARIVLYIGIVFVGVMLLLERPTPMAIAPSDVLTDTGAASG
jgi:hypothetical protein